MPYFCELDRDAVLDPATGQVEPERELGPLA
jgi:hypothetical protein